MGIMSIFVTFGIGYYLSSYEVKLFWWCSCVIFIFNTHTLFMILENGEEVSGVLALDRLGAKRDVHWYVSCLYRN